jgi:hypothetical protein
MIRVLGDDEPKKVRRHVLGLLVCIVLITAVSSRLLVRAEGARSSKPLSFVKIFPIVRSEGNLGTNDISIGITLDAQLTLREDAILSVQSSYKYAERGKSATLSMAITNAVSLLSLSGEAMIHFSFLGGSWDYHLMGIDIKYAVPEKIGSPQHIMMGEYLLYTGTVPVPIAPIQVSLFMRPVVTYTPKVSGSIAVQGPAVVSPTFLRWDQATITAQVQFSESQPVDMLLSTPSFTLEDFSLVPEVRAVVTAVPVGPVSLPPIVNAGDYSTQTTTVDLISFEPNYYDLYSELRSSYESVVGALNDVQLSLNQLSSRLDEAVDSLNKLNDRTAALDSKTSDIGKQLDSLKETYGETKRGVDELAGSVASLAERVNTLESTGRDVLTLFYIVTLALILAAVSLVFSVLAWRRGRPPLPPPPPRP